MGIETIAEGGSGGRATVYIQLRNILPGLGGMVKTEQDFVVAHRRLHAEGPTTLEELNEDDPIEDGEPLRTYVRHMEAKKLDDYFFRKGVYRFAHVPRPLGSTKTSTLYEWVHGHEGYADEVMNEEGRWEHVMVDELITAGGYFTEAGIKLLDDLADADNGRMVKNLIIQEQSPAVGETQLPNVWKRIDFGTESIHMSYDTLMEYIARHRGDLRYHLTEERVRMMELGVRFLKDGLSDPEMQEFSHLVYLYRQSTADHMGTQETSPHEHLRKRSIRVLGVTEVPKAESRFRRVMPSSPESVLVMENDSAFPSADGTIYTRQEIRVGKQTLLGSEEDSGFRLFLRHFLAKKLENAFIRQGRYSYAHISRPLGSEGSSYFYEWAYGHPRCPIEHVHSPSPSTKERGLDDWFEFAHAFDEAGIDMLSGVKEISGLYGPTAKQIIVRQPSTQKEPVYFSRLWKRVNFQEDVLPIDLEQLDAYLRTNETSLSAAISSDRFETMTLAVKYLRGKGHADGFLTHAEKVDLVAGLLKYRISALRHLDNYGFGYATEQVGDLGVNPSSLLYLAGYR